MLMDAKQPKKEETYVHDYDGALTEQLIMGRTAAIHAAFFLPYLRSGMNILDCACGPGTISVGLAQAVAPGKLTGIDLEASQLALARENAAKLGLTNVMFGQGSVFELPYEDSQFDAVFGHAVLEHMRDPLAVVKEMYRVLKPGGLVGIRSPDLGTNVYAPSNEVFEKVLEIYLKYRQHLGGTLHVGRRFRAFLREAGFVNTIGSASTEYWGTLEQTQSVVPVGLQEFAGPKITETAIQMGWADQALMDSIAPMLIDWGNNPDAFYCILWCEAVGWKG
jgi:ubiquinone/menaquinone biosynthesis C-methylase UbiE